MKFRSADLFGGAASVILLAALLCLSLSDCNAQPATPVGQFAAEHSLPLGWQELEPGLGLATLRFTHQRDERSIEVIALKADPGRFDFRILSSPLLLGKPAAALSEMHSKAGAIASLNGGYFQTDFRPTGLTIINGKKVYPYNKHGASGLFLVRSGLPDIVWAKDYKVPDPPDDYALQVGPLLVEPGGKFGMKKNTRRYTARSALCMDDSGSLVLVATQRSLSQHEPRGGLDLYELAQILIADQDKGGLGCTIALNLDGGPSTQFMLTHGSVRKEVSSLARVRNAIAIFPKTK